MVTLIAPRKIVATATASATLARGAHTPVDATSGAKTMTLPTNAAAGVEVGVEKVDASANAVTVSGTLRGVASSIITLTSQYEARTFLADGAGSWTPISDHRTASSLTAQFARRAAEVYDDFSTKADGQPVTSDSGSAWHYAQTAATGSAMTVISGLLTNTASNASSAAGYAEQRLSGTVTRMGAEVVIGSGGSAGVATLAITQASIADLYPTVPAMGMHLTIGQTTWGFGIWPSTGAAGQVVLATGSYQFTLDPATPYRIEVAVDGDTAYLLLPDGSSNKVQDSRIRTLAGSYAFWETFAQNASTDSKAKFRRIWASADPTPIYNQSAIPRLHQASGNMPVRTATSATPNTSVGAPTTATELHSDLRVVAIVPPSGKLLVRLTAWAASSAAADYWWTSQITNFDGSTQLRGPACRVLSSITQGRQVVEYLHVGLTPGQQIQARWLHHTTGTANQAWTTMQAGTGQYATITVTQVP